MGCVRVAADRGASRTDFALPRHATRSDCEAPGCMDNLLCLPVNIRPTRQSELPWFPSSSLGTRVREQTGSANVYVFPGLTRSRAYAYRGCCRRHRAWRGWPDLTYRRAVGEPPRCRAPVGGRGVARRLFRDYHGSCSVTPIPGPRSAADWSIPRDNRSERPPCTSDW